ncbi:MAG: A/G-specific adenine glycosylase [Pontimonas sp.]
MDTARVRQWYLTHQRDLPWRAEGVSAWQILTSEVMLQQTPVARVIPAWQAWCERWPTANALRSASLGEVLSQWNRLGYPRRAKNLHHSAHIVTETFGGELPRDVNTLETLPGIGSYTARAIACFAYSIPVPVVDTNVKRVVARAEDAVQAAGHWSVGFGLDRVDEVSATDSAKEYCQTQRGLMELGALICTARSPRCDQCPLQHSCRWRAEGYPEDPSVKPRVQARYEGSDRQVRGIILGWLRDNPDPLDAEILATLWPLAPQRLRALESLVRDGLIERAELPHGQEGFSLLWQQPGRGE